MPVLSVLEERVPVQLWTPLDQVEPDALIQLRNVAALPFVFHHVAVMPDVHVGIGATIGTVMATRGAVVPSVVGVDIGCGMMAVKTNLPAPVVQDAARDIRQGIEEAIPLGFFSNRQVTPSVDAWEGWKGGKGRPGLSALADDELIAKARYQLGSLGGGNHFIEVCLDEENSVWVMLHSGSRHIGNALANRHISRAKGQLRERLEKLPDPDLAWLTEGTPEFQDYMNDLHWCQAYAKENREEMMRRVLAVLARQVNQGNPVECRLAVNCHHNYAQEEEHFGRKVLVTRKGAVRAGRGDWGIIPGSMGAKSFIVRGLGNPQSFCSCSHGAGRRMSRTQARKQFSVEDLRDQTDGVECRKDKHVLDEIPGAYKDIDQVMANQVDLVEVAAQLRQILCVKG
ncbi:MAG: RtcB family protein [Deltaproteobacteria bacterium]|nr:RtcB family protein [Deltaproteobacteria bacterium]